MKMKVPDVYQIKTKSYLYISDHCPIYKEKVKYRTD